MTAPSHDDCAYCGLPVANTADSDPRAKVSSPRYCCYGCRFAASVNRERGDAAEVSSALTRLGLAIFFSMNVMVFTMLLWSQSGEPTNRAAAVLYDLSRYACLVFSIPVMLLLFGPLLEDALGELRQRRASMSLLLACGVLAAFGYSTWSVFVSSSHVYFEVACMVLLAVTLGRWLEASGKLQTTAALRSVQSLLPEQVRILRDGTELLVSRSEVRPGEILRVLPGERIAVDGRIVRNSAAVDEQAITGESVPIAKDEGDAVLSGTLCLDGELWIEATSTADDGIVQRMIDSVAQALAAKGRYSRLVDRISTIFLPLVAVAALTTLFIHWHYHDLGSAILAALAVVVIACPCALALATPMALWAAVGRAAREGVLLSDGDALPQLATARVVCFDKTGTLTTGAASVVQVFTRDEVTLTSVVARAAALAQSSTHPLSQAILHFAHQRAIARDVETESAKTLPGRGVIGQSNDVGEVVLGNERLLRERRLALNTAELLPAFGSPLEKSLDEIQRHGAASLCFVGWNGRVQAAFAFHEQLRPEAPVAIRKLQSLGYHILMLSGDRAERAAEVARQLGIEARGELLPADKLTAIAALQAEGRTVVMVGDGLNDAPALAAADVGVALASGTDVSRFSSSICLLRNDLRHLPWLAALARRTVNTIRWNLLWALAYNVIGVGVAATGWLNPIVAAVAMVVSSLLVVSNSLRLARDGEEDALLHSLASATACLSNRERVSDSTELNATSSAVLVAGGRE